MGPLGVVLPWKARLRKVSTEAVASVVSRLQKIQLELPRTVKVNKRANYRNAIVPTGNWLAGPKESVNKNLFLPRGPLFSEAPSILQAQHTPAPSASTFELYPLGPATIFHRHPFSCQVPGLVQGTQRWAKHRASSHVVP